MGFKVSDYNFENFFGINFMMRTSCIFGVGNTSKETLPAFTISLPYFILIKGQISHVDKLALNALLNATHEPYLRLHGR